MAWFIMAADGELRARTAGAGVDQDEVVVDDKASRSSRTGTGQLGAPEAGTLLGRSCRKATPPSSRSGPGQPRRVRRWHASAEAEGGASRSGSRCLTAAAASASRGRRGTRWLPEGRAAIGRRHEADLYGFYRRGGSRARSPRVGDVIWAAVPASTARRRRSGPRGRGRDVRGRGQLVEIGGLAGHKAEVDVGVAELEGRPSTRRHALRQDVMDRVGPGSANTTSDSVLTKNVAQKFGRGAQKQGPVRTASRSPSPLRSSTVPSAVRPAPPLVAGEAPGPPAGRWRSPRRARQPPRALTGRSPSR
jgi:hypothetical protein